MRTFKIEKSRVEEKLEEYFGGCYALFDNGECVYVGESSNIPHRLREHIQEGKKVFNDFRIYYCRNRKSLETDLIRLLKPKYNVSQASYDINVKKRENLVLKEALDAFSLSRDRIVCDEDTLGKIFCDYGYRPPYEEMFKKYDGYFGNGEYDLEIALRYKDRIQNDIVDFVCNEHIH